MNSAEGTGVEIGEVLSHGDVWMLCPFDFEHDAGYPNEWMACREALRKTGSLIEYFEGGDGCSVYMDGKWLAFGNTEESAYRSAYRNAKLRLNHD